MTIYQKMKAKAAIRKTAMKNGVSTRQCRQDMQAAIDNAWDNQDPNVRAVQQRLFPAGKPTAEEFITVLRAQIQ